MSIGHSTPRGGAGRRIRLIALASGPAALVATALAVMPAHAGSGDPNPATSYSPAQLAAVDKAIRNADVKGTAWSVDGASGRVVLAADSTVSTSAIDGIKKQAGSNAGALRVERLRGTLAPRLSGGDGAYARGPEGSWLCSVGFNTRDGAGHYYFLTAGHCTSGATDWYSDRYVTHIGTTAGSSFPGNDYGLVRYDSDNPVPPGTAGSQEITGAGDAQIGQQACRRGVTSGIHCGQVNGLNYTVNYAEGTVQGMIRTNICSEPGDSGGPLYAGSEALGLTSGGSGDCQSGGTTFFQPVTEALNAYGVSVY